MSSTDHSRAKFNNEVNRIHEQHEKMKHDEIVQGWVRWIFRIKMARLFTESLSVKYRARLESDHRSKSAKHLQKAFRTFAARKQRHDAADCVRRFWNFRNAAIKKKYAVSKMMAFLQEGKFIHRWWLLKNQIIIQTKFLQKTFRNFLKIQHARL